MEEAGLVSFFVPAYEFWNVSPIVWVLSHESI